MTAGFEPADNGVADRGLTAWLRHQIHNAHLLYQSIPLLSRAFFIFLYFLYFLFAPLLTLYTPQGTKIPLRMGLK